MSEYSEFLVQIYTGRGDSMADVGDPYFINATSESAALRQARSTAIEEGVANPHAIVLEVDQWPKAAFRARTAALSSR